MARLKKSNRVVDVKDEFADSYLKRGYDQIDDKGNVVKHATGGRTVSLPEYNKVIDENSLLKKQIEESKLITDENSRLKKQIEVSKLSVDELKAQLDGKKIAYAATDSKDALVTKIIAAD